MEYYYITADLCRKPEGDETLPVSNALVHAGRIRAIVRSDDGMKALAEGKDIITTCLRPGIRAINYGWMPEKDVIALGDKPIYDGYNTVTKISALRNKAGMTQQQLADTAGINIRMVQYLERGERRVEKTSLRTALSLADALEVDVRELM